MQLTAVFFPAQEGAYTAWIEGLPGAISEGETIEQARENLADALRTVLECNREIASVPRNLEANAARAYGLSRSRNVS